VQLKKNQAREIRLRAKPTLKLALRMSAELLAHGGEQAIRKFVFIA
jgi:hypothetical protein